MTFLKSLNGELKIKDQVTSGELKIKDQVISSKINTFRELRLYFLKVGNFRWTSGSTWS